MDTNWYQPNHPEKIDSPALLLFVERIKQNIQTAIKMTGDVKRLRPHVKTSKSPDATRLMLEAGITKFKCATIAEAEMLGMCQAPDVLLAYQLTGPKLGRFIELIKKYPATNYSCLTDNIDTAAEQATLFEQAGLQPQVYIDLNVGMNRTGIDVGEKAFALYQYCTTLKGIRLGGLHVYDGHLRHPDISIREKDCNAVFQKVEQLKAKILQAGLPEPQIIAGGSPTFPVHAKRKTIECSPGTFVYWDKGYSDSCSEQHFLPAAILLTRVISLPSPGKLCLDLGHKSVAAENELSKRVFFLNAPGIQPVGQSEEHLVVDIPAGHAFKVGEVLYGMPYHICPTVALYERAVVIENGEISGEWKTIARDRKISV
ncbi:MAG TPA: D-TA family PLP-dependent enzyme [Chitinophagaceae bacterium]|nr:D-TA family PLP-dependent enzyme [Chitinophagaceae bacterium]